MVVEALVKLSKIYKVCSEMVLKVMAVVAMIVVVVSTAAEYEASLLIQ